MNSSSSPMLSVAGVSKYFPVASGTVGAIQGLDLTVQESEFFVLLGNSGCGKTTLLRSIAGLERPDRGEISIGGKLAFSSTYKRFVEPDQRDVAMVFQSYAIWPHMTVFDNVAFPLQEARTRKFSKIEIAERVRKMLALVNLDGMEAHSAATLSGGQQQRVALARALIREPKLLLMDEPLSNLDAKLRERMRIEIKDLTRSLGLTTIHVTHDQAEAMAMADRMAVMSEGKILELGHPEELYSRPATRFVADFLGQANWFSGTVREPGWLTTPLGDLRHVNTGGLNRGSKVTIGIRPEWFELSVRSEPGAERRPVVIADRMFLGNTTLYRVEVGDLHLTVLMSGPTLPTGRAFMQIQAEHLLVYPAQPELPSTAEELDSDDAPGGAAFDRVTAR